MAELEDLAQQVLKDIGKQTPEIKRPTRASDQSFWGAGVPSLAVSSFLPPGAPGRRATAFGSGGGTWWHSPEDTIEHADKDVLYRDTALFACFAVRLSTPSVLPTTFVKVGHEFVRLLTDLERASGNALDLGGPIARAEEFVEEANRIQEVAEKTARECEQDASDPQTAARLARVNRCMMRLSRILNPALYSNVGMFHHPPAMPIPLLPGLQSSDRLATLDPDTDEFRLLRTQLVRERNRVAHALSTAIEETEMV
jgi:N-acetylated-alpha-linked acidic dipeptidase